MVNLINLKPILASACLLTAFYSYFTPYRLCGAPPKRILKPYYNITNTFTTPVQVLYNILKDKTQRTPTCLTSSPTLKIQPWYICLLSSVKSGTSDTAPNLSSAVSPTFSTLNRAKYGAFAALELNVLHYLQQ